MYDIVFCKHNLILILKLTNRSKFICCCCCCCFISLLICLIVCYIVEFLFSIYKVC